MSNIFFAIIVLTVLIAITSGIILTGKAIYKLLNKLIDKR